MPILKIFGLRNTPYARLSNNFRQKMYISGEEYPTVTNYIYANMLQPGVNRGIISRAKPLTTCKGNDGCATYKRSKAECEAANCTYEVLSIHDQFVKAKEDEQNNMKKECLTIALTAKLEQNPELAEKLLDTGNRPIVYISRGKWMGTQESNDDGENNYGRIVEAVRDKLIGERDQRIKIKNQDEREQRIYLTYLAYTTLGKLIIDGHNIQKYEGKTAPKIINLLEKNGVEISRVPNKEYIVKEAKKKRYGVGLSGHGGVLTSDIFVAFKKPKVLAAMVRGKYLAQEREKRMNRVPTMILNMYGDYLLKKSKRFQNLKHKDYAMAKIQQFSTISVEKKYFIAMELQDLYEKGMLSESLSKQIDTAIKSLNIPTEDDVKDAKSMAAAIRVSVAKEEVAPLTVSKTIGDRVLIWENNPPPPGDKTYKLKGLSPLDDSVSIRIGGKIYPSITYYCIANEFANCCIDRKGKKRGLIKGDYATLPSKAYNMIKVKDSNTFIDLLSLEHKLDVLKHKFYTKRLMENTHIALNAKFSDRLNQNVLLSTGNDKLVWADKNEPILGIKKPEEFNFVGIELMRLRDKIRQTRKNTGDLTDIGQVLSLKVLQNVFQNNFLKGWFNMRTRDMCNVILTMKDYLYVKYKIIQDINPAFVTSVLDNVYQPCSSIFAEVDRIDKPAPHAFIRMVKRYKGFLTFAGSLANQENVINVLWKHLAVVIYYLMKHLQTSTAMNIAIVLKKVEHLASIRKNCTKVIPDEEENCIFSALLNITSGIKILDNLYGQTNSIKEVDLNAAVTILLNIKSLTQQREMLRNLARRTHGKDIYHSTIPPQPRINKRITEDDINQIYNQLRGEFTDEIIKKVIAEVVKDGKIPDKTTLSMMAMAMQNLNKPTQDKKQRRPRIRAHRRPRIRAPLNKQSFSPLTATLSDSDEQDLDIDDFWGNDLTYDDDEQELDIDLDEDENEEEYEDENQQEYEDENEEMETKEEHTFTADPDISETIFQAFANAGVEIENADESFIFMVSDAIHFVKTYTDIPRKTKNNRINFFASPQWGMTIA